MSAAYSSNNNVGEDSEEEEGKDLISLSNSSLSTNPTPENPLYGKGDMNHRTIDSHESVDNPTKLPQQAHEQQALLASPGEEETDPFMLKQVKKEIEKIEDENNNKIIGKGILADDDEEKIPLIITKDNDIINSSSNNDNNNNNNNNTNKEISSSSFFPNAVSGLHADFHKSPEPIIKPKQQQQQSKSEEAAAVAEEEAHQHHLLHQIREDRTHNDIMELHKNSVPLADKEGGNSNSSSSNIDEDVPRAVGSSRDPDPIIGTITTTTPIDSSDSNNDIPYSYNPSTNTIGGLLRCSSSRDGITSTDGGSGLGYSLCPSPPSATIQMPTSPTPTKFGFTYKSSSLDDDDQNDDDDDDDDSSVSSNSNTLFFIPQYTYTKIAYAISKRIFDDANDDFAVATWLGFWAYLNVTCANYVLKPITDAVVLQVGVQYMPQLSLASSVLAFLSSVPIGWLFEAPEPSRRKVFKKMGMTRGETQGTSLALFYRFFALSALSYAVGFQLVYILQNYGIIEWIFGTHNNDNNNSTEDGVANTNYFTYETATKLVGTLWNLLKKWGQFMYIAFFLVVHLMKLHSTSLIWGVTTEAMEYEEIARKQHESSSSYKNKNNKNTTTKIIKTRLQRLAHIQFGGTLGGIMGSFLASSLAKILDLPGLLVLSACLLEISAQLSIELGRIMQKHWEEQQIFKSCQDLASLDHSMKRSASAGSMKRVASGNSLYASQQAQNMQRVASVNSVHSTRASSGSSSGDLSFMNHMNEQEAAKQRVLPPIPPVEVIDDNTFTQRLLRGVTTILKSRLLMTIFTYNALFASTTVLLSFQRAALVSNRNTSTTVSADTAFLANINMASSIAVFAVQSSRLGAYVTQKCGTRGSLALMPFIRLLGLIGLCWWHRSTNGEPPNLILFLVLDEFTRVINLAVAKPVRESLWSDLNNEARYEAKPIIDVLANRWGAGSASFCVSVVSRLLLFLGQTSTFNEKGDPSILGLPPVLLLGLVVSAWWLGVSLDLGQLRARIDLELKKHR